MSWPAARSRLHYTIAIVWLVYVVSLASWWLNIGLSMPARRRMFAWEGGSFIVLLVAGGVIMVLAIRREQRRRQALETFFMAFTHDLKTALARVQLQAESLGEDWPSGAPPAALDRLLRDTVRLQIQLENSLYVAQPDGRLLAERVDAAATIARLAQDWPDVTLDIAGAGVVRADARAFETVFRNLLQNAVLHGGASRVTVRIEHPGGALVLLEVEELVVSEVEAIAPIPGVIGDRLLEQPVRAAHLFERLRQPDRREAIGVIHPGVEASHQLDRRGDRVGMRTDVVQLAADELERLDPVPVRQQRREAERGDARHPGLRHAQLPGGGRRAAGRTDGAGFPLAAGDAGGGARDPGPLRARARSRRRGVRARAPGGIAREPDRARPPDRPGGAGRDGAGGPRRAGAAW